MNVGSTFSGVGGLDLGLERAGMRVLWQAEVDEWCRRVLRWHWPDADIYDDVRAVTRSALDEGQRGQSGRERTGTQAGGRREPSGDVRPAGVLRDGGSGRWMGSAVDADISQRGAAVGHAEAAARIDLLTGGFPCQDLSVAGKRAGLAGERSGLFFEFARIADELRPTWLLVENVVGLLSSANGRDMGVVLSTLAEIGYGLSWRVVDARYFGVPQRRRRVFIVGCLGDDGERAVRALGAGGEGDLEASRCSWQDAAGGVGDGVEGPGSVIANTLQVTCGDYSRADGFNMVTSAFYSTGGSHTGFARTDDVSPTLKVGSGAGIASPPAVSVTQSLTSRFGNSGPDYPDAEAGWIQKFGPAVRRLTPTECERLMSWPDGWTAVDGDKTPDSRRYAACGNGVVSNVAEWIGRRIMAVEREG